MSRTGLFERDPTDGKYHVVALSGGHDSSILSVMLKEQQPGRVFNYVCTPTGDELPAMYEHWRLLAHLLGKRIIPIMGGTLRKVIREQKMLPNFRARFCTRIIKIEPYHAVLSELAAVAPVVSYVGLRADEPGRAGGVYSDIPGVEMRFPLREWDMGETEVQAALADRGIVCPNRTDCARCYHQRLGEWYELWRDHPDIYADAEADEAEFGATYRSPGRDTWPVSLRGMRVRFEAGEVPAKSLMRMQRERETQKVGACRVCSL
jgi:hypothetical protein